MAIEAGQQLLHYRLAEKIGEGGMGVVWRATDTSLDRDVAIKVLPDVFADDNERLARFEREAKLLASLNHPNIASVFGLHQAPSTSSGRADVRFLAMELVDGEDLEARIARGALPVDEALELAKGIATALETAHDAGVIHRDLKPANVRIDSDGNVKVLDFGLAKAFDPATASGSQAPSLSLSPTMTSAGTVAGVILGTAGYMSPEQARAKPVDRRADIWAFGAVLYEMLTGQRLFTGETASDTLAAVLRADPEWDKLPAETPPFARRLVRRCLVRDPRSRLQSIGDARVEIEEWIADPHGEVEVSATPTAGPGRRSWIPLAIVATAIVAVTAIIITNLVPRPTPEPGIRAAIVFDPPLKDDGFTGFSFAPDGRTVAYEPRTGSPDDRLHLRDLTGLESLPVTGTESVQASAVSPDGRWIAFIKGAALMKIPIGGGVPVELATVTAEPRGISWDGDRLVYYAPGTNHSIWRVGGDGGEPEKVTDLPTEGSTNSHRWPTILPGGRVLLYLAGTAGNFQDGRVEVLDLSSGETKVLQADAQYPTYLTSGHIAFIHKGALMVVGFDSNRVVVTSTPRALVDKVKHSLGNGGANYAVSRQGALLYIPGGTQGIDARLKWMLPDGTTEALLEPGEVLEPNFSVNGRMVAYSRGLATNSDIWVYDLDRDVATRLTLDSTIGELMPVWMSNNRWVTYAAGRGVTDFKVYRKRANGSGEPELLVDVETACPEDWSSDDRMLLVVTRDRGADVMLARFDENGVMVGELEPFAATEHSESMPRFSPDDRWVVYQSNESGSFEIYVRATDGGGRWQVSHDGGFEPKWDAANDRILYRTIGSPNHIRSVSFVVEGGQPLIGRPEEVMQIPLVTAIQIQGTYDVHPDGRILAMTQPYEDEDPIHPILIEKWYQDF